MRIFLFGLFLRRTSLMKPLTEHCTTDFGHIWFYQCYWFYDVFSV